MKYQVRVRAEVHVWLEADTPKQALFIAGDIVGAKAGRMLESCCFDIEVTSTEGVELFEVPDTPKGAVRTAVDLQP